MKLDLKGFKRISKDKNVTTLQHPDGHKIQVNHSILSPKMRGEIEALPGSSPESEVPHFDNGGDVSDNYSNINIKGFTPSSSPIQPKKSSPTSTPMGTTSDPTDPNITGSNNPLVTSGQATTGPVMAGGPGDTVPTPNFAMAAKGGRVQKLAGGGRPQIPTQRPEGVPDTSHVEITDWSGNLVDNPGDREPAESGDKKSNDTVQKFAEGDEVQKEIKANDKDIIEIPAEGEESGRVSNPGNVPVKASGLEASLPDEEAEANKVADSTTQGQLNKEPDDSESVPTDNVHSNMAKYLSLHQPGVIPTAQLQVTPVRVPQSAPASAPVPDQSAQQPTSQPSGQAQPPQPQVQQTPMVANTPTGAVSDFQNYVNQQDQKNQQLHDEVAKGNIDPKRLFENQSTLSKILRIGGLIAGGLGAGASGGRNLAAEALQKQVEQDVDAQKANSANKMNLYKMNLDATHNGEEARNMTVNQLLAAGTAQIAQNLAPLQAQELTQNIKLKTQEVAANAYKAKIMQRLQNTPSDGTEANHIQRMNDTQYVSPEMYKDMESKYIPGIGVARTAVIPADRQGLIDLQEAQASVARAKKFQDDLGSVPAYTPTLRRQGQDISTDLTNVANKLDKFGRMNPEVMKMLKGIAGDVGSANLGGPSQGIKDLQTKLNDNKAVLYRNLGVTPFRDSQSQLQSEQPKYAPGDVVIVKGVKAIVNPDGKTARPIK